MRLEDFPFILDSKNGLVCCCMPVTPETEELTRSLRTYYAGVPVRLEPENA